MSHPTARALTVEVEAGALPRRDVAELPPFARLPAGLGRPSVVHRPAELRDEPRRLATALLALAARDLAAPSGRGP